ncbi:Sensor kinase CusS [Aquicella siphonis]|uniref:Sensor protein n=1 Tax=Aquicella siphonis TaxID=254247 RepID=A0A5E4PLX0_9COXI|nr:heavy metal sensor histidine kinase [Aquicella siphonis]VVC77293.1 Sensor kinase CusS [Aquicella siphonis]
MFLKNVKPYIRKKISIRTRLTLFYSLAAFIIMTVITLFLYWESVNVLYKADYQFLADEAESIQHILQNNKLNSNALAQAVIDVPAHHGNSIYRHYVRILDENNNTIIETPGSPKIPLVDPARNPPSAHHFKKSYRWYNTHDTSYLLVQTPVTLPKGKSGIMLITLDISYQHAVISDRKFLIIALLISTLCSLCLGFLAAQRGMRSLYTLTDTVKKITVTSLNQRTDPKSLPKELSALGVAFNQMLDRIESSFDRLKQFSSDLAHELRIPINNLIGETEITLSRAHSPEEYQQVLMSNLEEYHRISQLIENILFLSRAENPQMEIQKTSIYVQDEISIVCEYYEAMADEKNISVTCQGKAALRANSIMFRRMISNLLSNALKYTPDNGWIRFTITSQDNRVKIILSDNGIGISQEHLPKLFDRFYRVDSARSQLSGGIGLGLAIVKSIVDLHQGVISISSMPDQGTVIQLVFPA